MSDVTQRLQALEDSIAELQRHPLARPQVELQRQLEQTWLPDADTFLLPHSVGPGSLEGLERVTTLLPTTELYEGRVVSFVADSSTGVHWMFVYAPIAGDTYKWKFVGGPPLTAVVDTDETFTADSTWRDTATVGPSVTLPLGGDFDYRLSANMYTTAAATSILLTGLSVAGAGPAAPHVADERTVPSASSPFQASVFGRLVGRTAAQVLKGMYQGNAATSHARYRILQVSPVRCI